MLFSETSDDPRWDDRANKPSKAKTKASASLRKRKLEAESDQEELPRSKKGRFCSPQPENASYNPINVILTDKYAAKYQPKTLEYEWNSVRKLWIAEEAPAPRLTTLKTSTKQYRCLRQ